MNTDYTVKGFRRINGHDGQGWEANLYHGKTKIAEAFDNAEGSDSAFQHGVTYGGHPAVMTAALKNLEIIERDNLVANNIFIESGPAVTIDDAAADHDAFACRFAGGQAVALGPVHAD